MRRMSLLLLILGACFATVVQAKTEAPQPDPALQKLSVFVGHWTYEGEIKAGPWGPSTMDSGEYDGQMIFGGFFFQGRWVDMGAHGGEHESGLVEDAVHRPSGLHQGPCAGTGHLCRDILGSPPRRSCSTREETRG